MSCTGRTSPPYWLVSACSLAAVPYQQLPATVQYQVITSDQAADRAVCCCRVAHGHRGSHGHGLCRLLC